MKVLSYLSLSVFIFNVLAVCVYTHTLPLAWLDNVVSMVTSLLVR